MRCSRSTVARRGIDVADERALGDLEFQARSGEPGGREHVFDGAGETGVEELTARHVHADRVRCSRPESALPRGQLPAPSRSTACPIGMISPVSSASR